METRQFLRSRSDAEAQRNQEKLSIHSAEIGAINAQLQNLIQLKRAHDQLERDLLRREGQLDLLKAETWPGLLQRQADDVRTTELLQEMADLDQAIYHDEERKRQFAFWLEAFGLKGLKSFILDSRLVDMTHAANEWVRVLTGGTHWIRFESQSLTRGGKLAEKFNVRVFRHNPDGSVADRGYRSYSGGEKRRIALGIDWGLSCLVASRASKQWGVLVLDECFKHLDPGGKEAFFELLEAFKSTRSSVFVIDHDEAMSGHFGMGIVIHRQGGRSRITDEESCSSPSSFRAMPATA
jgi:DNA repair exonuclease SbcCD ATPase subunit